MRKTGATAPIGGRTRERQVHRGNTKSGPALPLHVVEQLTDSGATVRKHVA